MSTNTTETKKFFARQPCMKRRMCLMAAGILVMGLGLSWLIRLNLGTDPCSCFTLGLYSRLPFSFGTCQLLFQAVLFLIVVKFDRSLISYGTIGNMVFLGYIADFFTFCWDRLLPSGFPEQLGLRLVILVPVLFVFVMGAAAYMAAGLGVSPYDAVPFIIAKAREKGSFRIIRIGWDVCFLVGGLLLGGTVGVVTFLCALFLGPGIAWVEKKMKVFLN